MRCAAQLEYQSLLLSSQAENIMLGTVGGKKRQIAKLCDFGLHVMSKIVFCTHQLLTSTHTVPRTLYFAHLAVKLCKLVGDASKIIIAIGDYSAANLIWPRCITSLCNQIISVIHHKKETSLHLLTYNAASYVFCAFVYAERNQQLGRDGTTAEHMPKHQWS